MCGAGALNDDGAKHGVEVAQAKQALRRELIARRRSISPETREAAGRAVAERLLALPALRAAGRIALYAALEDELPTRPAFEALSVLSCRRLLPRIVGDGLEFAAVETWSDLQPGRFGVLTPPAAAAAEQMVAGDVMLIPGVAFGPAGERLGRGGGYYDRACARPGPLRVGLAFQLQLVDALPLDSHDRPVNAIVTESAVHLVSGRT